MGAWIDQIFNAEIASREGVVRRKIADVVTYASHDELLAEVRRRNFHLIETGDQYVIICNAGFMKMWC